MIEDTTIYILYPLPYVRTCSLSSLHDTDLFLRFPSSHASRPLRSSFPILFRLSVLCSEFHIHALTSSSSLFLRDCKRRVSANRCGVGVVLDGPEDSLSRTMLWTCHSNATRKSGISRRTTRRGSDHRSTTMVTSTRSRRERGPLKRSMTATQARAAPRQG